MVASWALGGLYFSLGPSVAAGVFGLHNHLIGGLVVTLLCAPGSVTAYLLRRTRAQRVLAIAGLGLATGAVLTSAGIDVHNIVLAAVGTLIAGIGFGAAALATFGTLAAMAAPTERAELFTVALVISYLAFSVPAVLAGFAATAYGLHVTALTYGIGVAALGAVALAAQVWRTR